MAPLGFKSASMLLAMMFSPVVALAGEKITVGQVVATNQQVSMNDIDHASWNKLLSKYVDNQGSVNYKAWKSNPGDVQALDTYLKILSHANRNLQASHQAQLAFWINAYNAVTIRGILREYPTSSIRNHTAKLFGYNIWHDLLLQVGDSQISLNDIEHKVLRKMNEPRIHFAIVCASKGCPRLLNQAYTADALEEQLTHNTRNFFANPANFQYDSSRQRFQLSSILEWFSEDFGNTTSERLKSIAPYLPTKAAYEAAAGNTAAIAYLSYDWSLNEQ